MAVPPPWMALGLSLRTKLYFSNYQLMSGVQFSFRDENAIMVVILEELEKIKSTVISYQRIDVDRCDSNLRTYRTIIHYYWHISRSIETQY